VSDNELMNLTQEEKDDIDDRIRKARPSVDTELQDLLDMVFGADNEHEDGRISMTLVTPGGIISGTAINGRRWHQQQIERFEAVPGGGGAPIAANMKAIDELALPKIKEYREAANAEGRPRPVRAYVHFGEVRVQNGGTTTKLNNLRVNLRTVVAWDPASAL
jgi:hypothetical protein